MKKIVTYPKPVIGAWDYTDEKKHKALIDEGWEVFSEEMSKEWDSGAACCLLIIFWPLALFAKVDVMKVTYEKK